MYYIDLAHHVYYMAVGQNQWHHFGVGAPPILVYFSGDWDVHWWYEILTHGHICGEASYVCFEVLVFVCCG